MIEDAIDLRATVGIFNRQRKIILATLMGIMAIALAYVFSLTPIYSSATLIQVNLDSTDLLSDAKASQNFSINNVRVEGEIEIIRSDAILQKAVLAVANLHPPQGATPSGIPLLNQDQASLTRAIRDFQMAAEVTRRGDTYLISLQVNAPDAGRAAAVANIWAESYLDYQVEVKVAAIGEILTIVQQRLENSRAALNLSESSFDSFLTQNLDAVVQFSGSAELLAQRLSYIQLQNQADGIQSTFQSAAQALETENWRVLSAHLNTDNLDGLISQRTDMQAQLDRTGQSPTRLALSQQLAEIDVLLRAQSQGELDILRQNEAANLMEQRKLLSQIRLTVLAGDLPPTLLTGFYARQQEAEITRAEYDTFLARSRELSMQAALQVADSRIVSRALPALKASSQNKSGILLAAFAIALFLGLCLAILREFWIGGFTSKTQLSNGLRLQVACQLPAISSRKSDADFSVAQNFVDAPLSEYAENIRRLRVCVDFSLAKTSKSNTSGKVVMVTSTLPGEGKSNTSLALGRAYAKSGHHVILLDCDFRNPRIHHLLRCNTKGSLLKILQDEQSALRLDKMNILTEDSGLNILAGPNSDAGLTDQILAGPRFSNLIAALRPEFDIIILDTPPLLPIVDSVHLAKLADLIILTVKWASTQQNHVRSAVRILNDAKNAETEIISVLSQERAGDLAKYKSVAKYYHQ